MGYREMISGAMMRRMEGRKWRRERVWLLGHVRVRGIYEWWRLAVLGCGEEIE